jgi:hypothetical protein
MKKITTLALLLIFSVLLVYLPEIGIVKAQSTIYIRRIEVIQEQLEEQSDMIRPEKRGKKGKENAKN